MEQEPDTEPICSMGHINPANVYGARSQHDANLVFWQQKDISYTALIGILINLDRKEDTWMG